MEERVCNDKSECTLLCMIHFLYTCFGCEEPNCRTVFFVRNLWANYVMLEMKELMYSRDELFMRSFENNTLVEAMINNSPLLFIHHSLYLISMMTLSIGNIFRATGHLCGEFTGHWWIPRTKASDAELWCFILVSARINGWVNNREAGDLRRHRAHYGVIVMQTLCILYQWPSWNNHCQRISYFNLGCAFILIFKCWRMVWNYHIWILVVID